MVHRVGVCFPVADTKYHFKATNAVLEPHGYMVTYNIDSPPSKSKPLCIYVKAYYKTSTTWVPIGRFKWCNLIPGFEDLSWDISRKAIDQPFEGWHLAFLKPRGIKLTPLNKDTIASLRKAVMLDRLSESG